MNDITGRIVRLNDLIKVTLYDSQKSAFYVVAIGPEGGIYSNWIEGLIVNILDCESEYTRTLQINDTVIIPAWYHLEVVGNTGDT